LPFAILYFRRRSSHTLTSDPSSHLQMNVDSHVVLCGQISQYNKDVPYPPPLSDGVKETLRRNNITRERFTVLNYMNKAEAALSELGQLVQSGQINVRRKWMMMMMM